MDDIEESYVTKTEPAPNEQQDKELEDHQRNQQVKPAALETNTIASWETTGAGLTCDNNVMCLPNHLHVGSHVQDLKQDLTSIVKKDDHSGAKRSNGKWTKQISLILRVKHPTTVTILTMMKAQWRSQKSVRIKKRMNYRDLRRRQEWHGHTES